MDAESLRYAESLGLRDAESFKSLGLRDTESFIDAELLFVLRQIEVLKTPAAEAGLKHPLSPAPHKRVEGQRCRLGLAMSVLHHHHGENWKMDQSSMLNLWCLVVRDAESSGIREPSELLED